MAKPQKTDRERQHQAEGLSVVKVPIEAAPESEPPHKPGIDLSMYRLVSDYSWADLRKTWIVEGLLEAGRVIEVFGTWRAGKTLAVQDLCAHLDSGVDTWAGRRLVRCLVVWIAGEAVDDVIRRFKAWELRHGVDALGIRIRTKPVYLSDAGFAEQLRREIEAIRQSHPELPVLLVIDTVARSLAPGANENSIEGLGALANNLIDLVVHPTGCTCLAINHSGHGDKERSRGHSSFIAAIDGTIKATKKDSTITLTTGDMRSSGNIEPMEFRIEVQELPIVDNFGNPVEEPVLRYLGIAQPRAKEPTGNAQKVLLKVLRDHQGYVKGHRMNYSTWQKTCCETIPGSSFRSAKDALVTAGLLVVAGGEVYEPSDENDENDEFV